jgi:ssDNA-binding Zn-finger/Zn-ribbon topoisomerase 1
MDNIQAEKISTTRVCAGCGGNLVIMQSSKIRGYWLRCAGKGCNVTEVGTKKAPYSPREQKAVDEYNERMRKR